MTDTARDEHSPKNGALSNGGNHRGIPPSGVTTHGHSVQHGHASQHGQAGQANAESSRTIAAVGGASAAGAAHGATNTTFGSTELRPSSELESGVHPTVHATAQAPALGSAPTAVRTMTRPSSLIFFNHFPSARS
mgnify:CR=1 FL=1